MSTFKAIRQCLGVTQAEMSRALGMSQGNISFLERGQTVTPDTAAKLISFAASLGVKLSYDQVYGAAELPAPRVIEAATKAA
jgi:putative transcriptional regulator